MRRPAPTSCRSTSTCCAGTSAGASDVQTREAYDMRLGHLLLAAAAALIMGSTVVGAAPPISLQPDGSLQIAARKLRCGDVRNVLDARLPNLGISVPDAKLLVINPARVARQPGTVRLFVYYHECGHHHVGASELSADCWAVRRGVREGWLNRLGSRRYAVIRQRIGNPTHPSAARRCSNLAAVLPRRCPNRIHHDPRLPVRKSATNEVHKLAVLPPRSATFTHRGRRRASDPYSRRVCAARRILCIRSPNPA